MTSLTEIDIYREELKKLRTQREKATVEKGLAAEENKDLRENFAYDYWVQQEQIITAKIARIIKHIEDLAKQQNLTRIAKPKRKTPKKV